MSKGKGGGGGSPPPAPDPYAIANAQTGANINSALGQQNLNAVNQVNPYGSLSYTRDPTTGQMTQTTALNPAGQFQLGAQQLGGAYLSGVGLSDLSNVAGAMSPLDFNGLPQQVSGVNVGNVQTQLHPQGNALPIQQAGNIGQVSGGSGFHFDTSNMPNLNQDYGKQFQDVSNSVLKAQMPVLNQLTAQQTRELNDRLAGQGITQGSDAWNREAQLLSQNQGQNYNSLAEQAYKQGLDTQGQLFNQTLGSRQQLFGEQATQAQNQMQAQQLSEQASAANAQNELAKLGINNAAQAQQYMQALSSGQFANAGQEQQFGQGLQNAGLQNAARQTGLQEQLLAHQQPLQQYQALQSLMGSPTSPSFAGYPTAAIGSPDIQGAFQNAYAGQQNAYNQRVASQNAKTSGLLGLGGTIGGAALMGPAGGALGGYFGRQVG